MTKPSSGTLWKSSNFRRFDTIIKKSSGRLGTTSSTLSPCHTLCGRGLYHMLRVELIPRLSSRHWMISHHQSNSIHPACFVSGIYGTSLSRHLHCPSFAMHCAAQCLTTQAFFFHGIQLPVLDLSAWAMILTDIVRVKNREGRQSLRRQSTYFIFSYGDHDTNLILSTKCST